MRLRGSEVPPSVVPQFVLISGVPHALGFKAQFTCGGGVLKSLPPLFQGTT
jgi:hypothetical protein